ncbi:MAG: L-histidine N(alpha)-methyltransferase [Candidatus Absconditicoccaceae bacterium]
MNQIYNLISDGNLNDELAYCLRNRSLEQKFLYMNNGANRYYDIVQTDNVYYGSYTYNFFIDFGLKNIFSKNKNIAIISLGCGNSDIESFIFENLGDDFKIAYYGVDSSKNMLELSIKRMEKINNIEKYFICADFSTNEFKRELSQLASSSDSKIFTFFSNTFGNINPNNIIDILYNLLKSGEKIWLDVRLRSGKNTKDDLKDFEKYYGYLSSKEMVNLFLNPIEGLSIPQNNGTFSLKTQKIQHLEAIKYQYNFIFNKKTEISIKNETTTILPGEELKIVNIYTYDVDGLIRFFEGHNFKLIENLIQNNRGQFLFEKI